MQNEADFQSGEHVGRVGFINPATRAVLWMRWVDGANPAYGRALGVGGRDDDLVGGFGQLGEAVGQAGAGQDEVVGVDVFGLAEFGQQVQVVAERLQLLVGFFRQVVAGLAWRSVPISIK